MTRREGIDVILQALALLQKETFERIRVIDDPTSRSYLENVSSTVLAHKAAWTTMASRSSQVEGAEDLDESLAAEAEAMLEEVDSLSMGDDPANFGNILARSFQLWSRMPGAPTIGAPPPPPPPPQR